MEYAQFDEYDLLGRLPQSVFGGEVFAGCLLISRTLDLVVSNTLDFYLPFS